MNQNWSQLKSEYRCVKEALWYEARGESEEGIRAVLGVILNRKLHKKFPDTFCGVIEQRKQFSYRNHLAPSQRLRIKPRASEKDKEYLVHEIALEAVMDRFENPLPTGTIFYHTHAVNPVWSKGMNAVESIGGHKFFKPKEKK